MKTIMKGLVCPAASVVLAFTVTFSSGCAGLVSGTNNTPSSALAITNVQAGTITTSTCQIVWTTNIPANSSIDYGTTPAFGNSTPVNSAMVTSHQMTLSGLAAGTSYYFQVSSSDSKGNHGHGGNSFKTAGFSVSGTINPAAAGSGTTLTISGAASGTTAADGSGAYSFSGLPNGSYSITPSNLGYTFSPTSQNISVTSANVAGVNFSASTINAAPSITTQPASQVVTAGQPATFSVAATGTGPLSYQWQKNGVNISGATSSSYTTAATTTSQSGTKYDVVVSNSAGSVTSASATLTVNAAAVAPTITTQPANETITAGQTATFTVVASGTAPLSYQWQQNGVNISGATASSYTTPATTTSQSGTTFDVVVSNSAGSVTSAAATLTVNAAAVAPTITTQPANETVVAGQTATFTAVANGTGPLSYQWLKNGANISGATSSSYTTPATTTSQSGTTFDVVVTNSAGSVTSTQATMTVNAAAVAPTITTQPANQTVTAGQTATFTVVASGTAPLSYQWQKNGANIAGATSSTYTTPATTASDSGSTFDVIVTNTAGSVTSSAAALTVNASTAPPTVPTGLTATAVSSSQINLSWSASTDSSGTLAGYKIYLNGTQVGTSTTTSYQSTGLAASTTYTYNVAAYDIAGNTSAQSLSASAMTQGSSGGGGGTGGSWIPGFGHQGWYQYSANTILQNVCPPNNYNGTSYAWNTECVNVMDAWGGAAYDQVGHCMVIWGGGHQDYPGNEVYEMCLGQSSSDPNAGHMIRLNNPTTANQSDGGNPANENGSTGYGWLSDSRGNGVWPNAYHTYYNLTVDRSGNFWFLGGVPSNTNGGTSSSMGKFNLSSLAWTRIDNGPTPGSGSIPGDCGNCLGQYEVNATAFNPNTGHIMFITGNNSTSKTYDYNPSANTSYLVVNSSPSTQEYNGMVYDSVDNILYEYGSGDWNYTTPGATPGTWPSWAAVSGGCYSTCSAATNGSGAASFDTVNDLVYFFPGSGSTVYTYAPKTNTWTAITTNTNPCSADGSSNGIYGRFQFDPTYQVAVYAANPSANVCVWWPKASTGGGGGSSSPSITALAPSSGPVGTAVTITGTNFGTSQGSSTVTFNGTAASVTSWSATSIAATVPSGATTGNVVVTVGGQASNSMTFTVSAPPAISVNINPTAATLQVSATQQFAATVTGSTDTAVTWTVTGGTMSTSGLYTAPSSTGTFTITATSVADTTKSASAAVTVTSQGTGAINGWSSRIGGINIPGGASSIVSDQSFDAASDVPTCSGPTFPCSTYSKGAQFYTTSWQTGTPSQDCTAAADGPCSIKFTVANGSFQGDSGYYDYNFNSNLTAVYGNGQEFFIQYKERFDPGILGTFSGAGGLKHDITTEGDTNTVQAGDCSNSPGEIVTIQDMSFNGPWIYVNCGYSSGSNYFTNAGYEPLQLSGAPGTNFLDQNASGCPHYAGQGGIPVSDPTCFLYVADEWFTVQIHVKVGAFGSPNSVVEQWFAHAGSPSVLVSNASDAAIPNDGSGGASGKYGKIQLSTYDTGATFNVNTAAWFDDLIVSTRRIPDPDIANPNAPDSLSLSNISASSVTMNWRVNSQNGTAQDDTGFLVERCTGDGPTCFPNPQSGFQQIGTTAPAASSYVDNTVVSGTTYTYRVRAKNTSGNSAYTIAQCFNGGTTCGGTVTVP